MSDTTRDPRVDPRPGDVLLLGAETRTVVSVGPPGAWIDFQITVGGNPNSVGSCGVVYDRWLSWAKKAEVTRDAVDVCDGAGIAGGSRRAMQEVERTERALRSALAALEVNQRGE